MEIDKHKNISINGENLKIAIILPYFNESLGLELLKNAKNSNNAVIIRKIINKKKTGLNFFFFS